MPALPAVTDFTDAAVTEGQFKTALTTLHSYLSTLLGSAGTQSAALAALGALGAGYALKTSAYTILTTDRGKTIAGDSTFEIVLPNVATAGAGWAVVVANVGDGVITVTASHDINGESTLDLGGYDSVIITSTGTEWLAVGGGRVRYAQERLTGSGNAVIPAWANAALFTGNAGGGGGGGADLTAGLDGGEGGAGGRVVRSLITGLVGGDTIAYSIGGGGSAGANASNPVTPTAGGTGGATTFGSISLGGGGGGARGGVTGSARGSSGATLDNHVSNGGIGGKAGASPKSPSAGYPGAGLVEWIRI